MTQDEVDKKMVRVLWLLVSITSALAGFLVGYGIDKSFGWGSMIIGIGIWLVVGFILQRQEFKGASKHTSSLIRDATAPRR